MNMTNSIKVFQVDDWAYVAAQSADEAGSFIESTADRADDLDDRESVEIAIAGDIAAMLQIHIESGEEFPALIGIDSHYA